MMPTLSRRIATWILPLCDSALFNKLVDIILLSFKNKRLFCQIHVFSPVPTLPCPTASAKWWSKEQK